MASGFPQPFILIRGGGGVADMTSILIKSEVSVTFAYLVTDFYIVILRHMFKIKICNQVIR